MPGARHPILGQRFPPIPFCDLLVTAPRSAMLDTQAGRLRDRVRVEAWRALSSQRQGYPIFHPSALSYTP